MFERTFRSAISALVMCGSSFLPHDANAWNGEGHKIVAIIAERHLSDAAYSATQKLLALEGSKSLEDVAVWADEVRDLKVPQQPSHALRLPLDGSVFSKKRDCDKNLCATAAISAALNCLNVCRPSAQLLGLKYLVHLVGDIHQPLHSSADTGQQKVIFKSREYSLHQVWDGVIIQDGRINFRVLAGQIDEQQPFQAGTLDPIEWAYEGRNIAKNDIFPVFNSFKAVDGAVRLPEDYAIRYRGTVEARLKLAGLRLAGVLNAALSAPH